MGPDTEKALTAVGTIAAVILTKLGWDRVKPRGTGGDDEPQLSDVLKPRETVLMHVANRIHAVRDDIAPKITGLYTKSEIADIRFARLEADQLETKKALAEAIERIHAHIDRRQDKLEEKFDAFIERRRVGA